MSFTVTDINNNPLKNEKPIFIKINGKSEDNIELLLNIIDKEKDNIIYDINMKEVNNLLSKYKLNNIYKPFYQIYRIIPSILVLVHKDFVIPAQMKNNIMPFNKGYIILYEQVRNYAPFNVFYTMSVDRPEHYLIKKELVQPSDEQPRIGLFSSFQLNALSLNKSNKIIPYTNSKVKQFRLLNNELGSYLSFTELDGLKLTSDEYASYQKLKLKNGLLEIDGKCITLDNNGEIKLDKCELVNDKSIWGVSDNSVISLNTGKCLDVALDNKKLILNDCKLKSNSATMDWSLKDIDNINDLGEDEEENHLYDKRWPTYKGRSVVLVNSDNPWYLNKDITLPQKINPEAVPLEYDEHTNILVNQTNGKFQSKFMINTKRPDLGYGYSYASRLGKPCYNKNNKTTNQEESKNKPQNNTQEESKNKSENIQNNKITEGFGMSSCSLLPSGTKENMILLSIISAIIFIIIISIKRKK
jgi:hypothetical protein